MNETNPTPTQQGGTLLPCPWCLGPAVMSGTNNGDTGDGYMWKIGCAEENDCTVQPEFYYESEQLAVTRWNTRAAVAGPQGVIELLSASLLHPESAEGYVRQAIEMLSAAATSSPAPAEGEHPFVKMMGTLADHPLRDEWLSAMGYDPKDFTDDAPAPAERTRVEGEQEVMTTNSEHPIYTHVDDYVKTLQWSPEASEYEKTLVIGNLRGFASHLASIEAETDILDDERVGQELRRWQDAIRDKLIEMGAPDWKVDGGSCDSGDPLDFTLAEVGQGCGYFIDQLEELRGVPTSDSARRAAEEIADYVSDGILGMGNEVTETNRAKFLEIINRAFAAAPADNDAESLLLKVTTIADIGSAEEFGDALERLKSIRELVDTTTKEDR